MVKGISGLCGYCMDEWFKDICLYELEVVCVFVYGYEIIMLSGCLDWIGF